MDISLAGKVALITGGSRGIGLAIAKSYADSGAQVMLTSRKEDSLRDAAQFVGGGASYIAGNAGDTEFAQKCVSATLEQFGKIDIFINNAGLGGEVPIVEMTDDQWSLVLDVTLNGTFRCMRAEMQYLYANGGGVIVNNASVLGWRAQEGQAHYAAAKAGVMALTRCAAIEAAPHDVRINAVAPSLAMHPFLAKATTEETLAELTKREAFGRAAEPWEVANVMMFLASDYSSYMTGEIVSVSSQRA